MVGVDSQQSRALFNVVRGPRPFNILETPSATSEHFSELLGCPISRSLTTSCVGPGAGPCGLGRWLTLRRARGRSGRQLGRELPLTCARQGAGGGGPSGTGARQSRSQAAPGNVERERRAQTGRPTSHCRTPEFARPAAGGNRIRTTGSAGGGRHPHNIGSRSRRLFRVQGVNQVT